MDEGAAGELAVAEHTSSWAGRSLDALVAARGVRRAGIAVLEGGGRRLNFTSAEHVGERPVRWCQVDAYDDVPLNTAVRSGRPVVGSMASLSATHGAFVERQRGTGSAALAAVPIVGGGQTLGGFVLYYEDASAIPEGAVGVLRDLGRRLGERLRDAQVQHAAPVRWGRTPEPGALVVRFAVADHPAAVGPARQRLRDALTEWGVGDDTTSVAALCLSELVTNAVVHGGSGCLVELTSTEGGIAVAVRSAGAPTPAPEAGVRDPLQVHGRGLQLVDALASRWGLERDAEGSTAWFVVDV